MDPVILSRFATVFLYLIICSKMISKKILRFEIFWEISFFFFFFDSKKSILTIGFSLSASVRNSMIEVVPRLVSVKPSLSDEQ